MPAPEAVAAWRVVATPSALEAARWHGEGVEVLRIAPDEALGLGASGVEVDDPDAIVEPEAGFSSVRLTAAEVQHVLAHVEWAVPDGIPDGLLAQGKVAGVPAKLLMGEPARLVVQTCSVDELRDRLGW